MVAAPSAAAFFAERPPDLDHAFFCALDAGVSPKSSAYAQLLHQILRVSTQEAIDQLCEVKSYSDCQYHNFKSRGISFCFDRRLPPTPQSASSSSGGDGGRWELAAIHVYNDPALTPSKYSENAVGRVEPFQAYRFHRDESPKSVHMAMSSLVPLPYQLDSECTLRDMVEKFAPVEPEKGGGGAGSGGPDIWIRYQAYGLQAEFPYRRWDDACGDIPWKELIFTRIPSVHDNPELDLGIMV